MRRTLLITGCLIVLAAPACAQTDPVTLPAQDRHEGLLVAADPWLDTARAKEKFGKANPLQAGVVPIEVFLRNETEAPMRINLESVVLEISQSEGPRQRLDWLDAGQVAFLIAHPNGVAQPQPRRRIAIGIPLPSKDKKVQEYVSLLQPFALDADVIPPHATLHGFLFFNLAHDNNLLTHASLYLPDIKLISGNKPLMYFEVDLHSAIRH